jgi:hypothetical protein
LLFFFAQFYEESQNKYGATFNPKSGTGSSNEYLKRMGFYPIFANVAESNVFSYSVAWWKFWKKDLNRLDQVFNTPFNEVMSFVEYKSAIN